MATPLTTTTELPIAAVEHELRALWQAAAESDAVSRASLFNLVAVTATDAEYDHVTTTIRKLTNRHPCRAIVLRAGDDDTAPATAQINAHCHLTGGGQKQVCCEQITVHAGAPQLPAAMLALLEGDLPVVLWWPGDLTRQAELFRQLSALADRVIGDTSHGAPPATAPAAWFTDISWLRLAFWREQVAEFFDEPAARALVPAIESVAVEYTTRPGAARRAGLLAAWFARQAGWSARGAVRRVRLALSASSETTDAGVLAIELRAASAWWAVRKDPAECTVTATVTLPTVCGLPRKRSLWPGDEPTLISWALDETTPDPVYPRVLALAARLLP